MVNIAVVMAGDLHYGLLVDALLDSEEIVVKPLGQHLQGCKLYAGATILGDGCVALILDVMGVRTIMHLAEVQDAMQAHRQQTLQQTQHRQDTQTLLLVKNASHEQFAIPLNLVSRIERISASAIEHSGGRRHMQYRGSTLRLLALEEVAQVSPREETETLSVIVFSAGGREVGLMVSSIVDVMETEVSFDNVTFRQPGILGSAILMGRTTLLVDLFGLVATALPEWIMKPAYAALSAEAQRTVLIVEDSHFFLQHITNFVEDAGYHVMTAMDGVQALEVLEQHGEQISLVLTDIEMPNMDGLELTQHIRNHARFASLPVIAVTSVAGEAAEKRGLGVGIDAYLIKLDQEKVLHSVAHYLTARSYAAPSCGVDGNTRHDRQGERSMGELTATLAAPGMHELVILEVGDVLCGVDLTPDSGDQSTAGHYPGAPVAPAYVRGVREPQGPDRHGH